MNNEPTCGKCGGILTPYNAKRRPELFLHDRCLPAELRPPEERYDCRFCKIECGLTEAEAFIHEKTHNGGPAWTEFGAFDKLNQLPYILFPIVAKLMEEWRRVEAEKATLDESSGE